MGNQIFGGASSVTNAYKECALTFDSLSITQSKKYKCQSQSNRQYMQAHFLLLFKVFHYMKQYPENKNINYMSEKPYNQGLMAETQEHRKKTKQIKREEARWGTIFLDIKGRNFRSVMVLTVFEVKIMLVESEVSIFFIMHSLLILPLSQKHMQKKVTFLIPGYGS